MKRNTDARARIAGQSRRTSGMVRAVDGVDFDISPRAARTLRHRGASRGCGQTDDRAGRFMRCWPLRRAHRLGARWRLGGHGRARAEGGAAVARGARGRRMAMISQEPPRAQNPVLTVGTKNRGGARGAHTGCGRGRRSTRRVRSSSIGGGGPTRRGRRGGVPVPASGGAEAAGDDRKWRSRQAGNLLIGRRGRRPRLGDVTIQAPVLELLRRAAEGKTGMCDSCDHARPSGSSEMAHPRRR